MIWFLTLFHLPSYSSPVSNAMFCINSTNCFINKKKSVVSSFTFTLPAIHDKYNFSLNSYMQIWARRCKLLYKCGRSKPQYWYFYIFYFLQRKYFPRFLINEVTIGFVLRISLLDKYYKLHCKFKSTAFKTVKNSTKIRICKKQL